MHLTAQHPNIWEANMNRMEKRNSNAIRGGDFNEPLPLVSRTIRQKINKETGLLHYKSVRSKRHIEQSHPARASIAKYECMEYSPESTVLRHRVSADSKGLILRQIIFFNHVERN